MLWVVLAQSVQNFLKTTALGQRRGKSVDRLPLNLNHTVSALLWISRQEECGLASHHVWTNTLKQHSCVYYKLQCKMSDDGVKALCGGRSYATDSDIWTFAPSWRGMCQDARQQQLPHSQPTRWSCRAAIGEPWWTASLSYDVWESRLDVEIPNYDTSNLWWVYWYRTS